MGLVVGLLLLLCRRGLLVQNVPRAASSPKLGPGAGERRWQCGEQVAKSGVGHGATAITSTVVIMIIIHSTRYRIDSWARGMRVRELPERYEYESESEGEGDEGGDEDENEEEDEDENEEEDEDEDE